MSELLERFEISEVGDEARAWLVRFDGAPLLHLTENHLAINDLRASHQFRWGFALLRNPWTESPRLSERDGVVDFFGGEERVGILRWDAAHPTHVEVTVFDLGDQLLHTDVRYRQMPAISPRAEIGL